MTEEKPVEAVKVNAEDKPKDAPIQDAPKVNVENHIDLSAVLTKMDTLYTEFATLKANIAEKDTKIKTLEEAETLRQNEARAQADAAAKAGFAAILNQNAKLDIDKLYPEYVKSPALWIVTNTKLLDVKGIESGSIAPTSQAFVPHMNASEDEELKGLMPTDEEAGMRKVA